jgi:hypothetical protein
MMQLEKILAGGDLRSIGKSNSVVAVIQTQNDFDDLFKYLFHKNRLVVMRAADAIEKITINNPQYMAKHKKTIFELCDTAKNKELKWHLALLLPRLNLDNKELGNAWSILTSWAKDNKNSRIVRVNSIQGLFELLCLNDNLISDFKLTITEVEKENIPSINARIRTIKKSLAE